MKLKSYPKYKDSGIDWIGEIPEVWEVRKLKYLLKIPVTDGPHETPEFIDEGIPFLSVDSIQDGKLIFENCRHISEEDHVRFKKKCNPMKGDIFLGKAASIGKIAIVNVGFEFSIWSPLALLRPNNKVMLSRFMEYALKSDYSQTQIEILATSNTQKNISMDDIPRIRIIVSPLRKQISISDFLDKKTAEIDELIEKDKKLIELLKEKRTALINHAVTKGLDQNVKMKDSGIEWIGEIPEDWEILRLRYLLKNGIEGIKIGPFGSMLKSDEITNNGYKVYGQENVINRNFNKGSRYINEDKFKQLIGYQIHPGDLIITMMGTIGKAQIIPTIIDEGIMDSHLIRLRFNGKVETKFIEILINSSNYIKGEIKYFSKGSIMEGLNSGIIKDLLLCIPQKIEQTKIIQFVNRKVTKIDKTIQKIEEKIKFLEEYKKSSIHHAVTGKIDIREVKI